MGLLSCLCELAHSTCGLSSLSATSCVFRPRSTARAAQWSGTKSSRLSSPVPVSKTSIPLYSARLRAKFLSNPRRIHSGQKDKEKEEYGLLWRQHPPGAADNGSNNLKGRLAERVGLPGAPPVSGLVEWTAGRGVAGARGPNRRNG